jgi:hypothetical protein
MDNKEVERLMCGDVDYRIAVATTAPLDVLDAIKTASVRSVIAINRWEDTFGDRIAWEKAEEIIDRRRKSYSGEYPVNLICHI